MTVLINGVDTLDTKFLRNKDLIDQSKLDEVTIVGLGGIGSAVVTLASAMGFSKIRGYDDDLLEEHNLSTCVYPHTFVGKSKAYAARETALAHGCPNVQMDESKWTLGSDLPLANKVIMGPDNMDARMDVYRGWIENPDREWLIDFGQSGYVALYRYDGIKTIILAVRHQKEVGYS